MKKIQIWVGTTWIKLPVSRQGCLPDGTDMRGFVTRELCEREWDAVRQHYILLRNHTAYDLNNNLLIMPRYALDKVVQCLEDIGYSVEFVEVEPYTPRQIDIRMKKGFEPRDNQPALINFLTDLDRGYKPVAAATGTGKTYCAIRAMSGLGHPALIVLGFLIDQWYKSLLQFTTLRKDDIYVVQGFDSLKDLWEMLNNGFEPKVVIFSTRTLAMYAIDQLDPYTTLPSYAEFQQKVGFGVLVHDETHLNFYTNTQIDIRSNIKHNIFLSATYQRSDYQGNRIFNMVFPRELLFGAQFVKKYTSVTVVGYRLGISQKVVPKFMVAKGYLHAKYENWLVAHHTFFESFMRGVLRVLINMYYTTKKKDGQKLLILCQTKKFVLEVVKYLKDMLTDKVTAYFSGDSKYGNAKLLNTAVIVSTIKSCSTGIDIKGLKTCINTVSFRSEPQAAQCMGRLRQIPGEETIYIDIWNKEIPSHYYHQKSRVNVYKTKALTFYQTDL